MPYQSIFGPTGTPTLANKTNPYAGDFKPGQYATGGTPIQHATVRQNPATINSVPNLKSAYKTGAITRDEFVQHLSRLTNSPTKPSLANKIGNILGGVKQGATQTATEIAQSVPRAAGELALSLQPKNTAKAPPPNRAGPTMNIKSLPHPSTPTPMKPSIATINPSNPLSKALFGKTPLTPIQTQAKGAETSHPGGFHIKGTPITLSSKGTGAAEGALKTALDIATLASVKGGAKIVAKRQAKIESPSPSIKTPKITPTSVTKIAKPGQGSVQKPNRADLAVDNPTLEEALGTIKNPKMPEVTTPTSIPKEGRFRGAVSVSGNLSRLGKSGQEIASRLSKAESASETGQAEFLNKIPTVKNLKKNEFPQFVDTLDKLEKAKPVDEQKILSGLTSKMKQAVDEWSTHIPTVRGRGSDAGIDVGDLGKYYFPRNYTELLKNNDGLSRAAKHLVDTGQADTLGDAVQNLRFMKNEYSQPFGHFERSRSFDLPGYDKSKNAMLSYIQGAYNKIGHAEQFGPKGEVASQLIGNISKEGYNASRAQHYYNVATGMEKYGDTAKRISSDIRTFNRVTKLGLSSILNATQSTNTASLTGSFRTAKAALKTMGAADRAYVDKTGTIIDSVINDLREQAGLSGAAKSGINKILNAPGFGAVEKFNRRVATIAGKDWADALAAKGSPRSLSILRDKLGVEGDIGKKLTPEQQVQASRKVVELTQFKTGAKDLPAWADSPQGKLVSQFRTFSYKQTGFVYNELIKTALKGNPLPLLRYVSIGIPLGFAAGNIRGTLRAQPWQSIKGDQEKPGDSGLFTKNGLYQALNNVGASGLASNAIFVAQNSKSTKLDQYITSSVGGPTAGQALTTVQNVAAARRGQPKELGREALSNVPVVGPALKNKLLPYAPSNTDSLNRAIAGNQYVKDTLKQTGVNPGAPKQTQRGKQLDNQQYQKFMDDSNRAFVEKVLRARRDPGFQNLSKDNQKRTLEKALTDARTKTADKLLGKAPKATRHRLKSY